MYLALEPAQWTWMPAFSAIYGLMCLLLKLGGLYGEYIMSPPRAYGTRQLRHHKKDCSSTLLCASSTCFPPGLQEETRKGVVIHGEPLSHKAFKTYINVLYIRLGQDIPYPSLDDKPSSDCLALISLLLAICAASCLFRLYCIALPFTQLFRWRLKIMFVALSLCSQLLQAGQFRPLPARPG